MLQRDPTHLLQYALGGQSEEPKGQLPVTITTEPPAVLAPDFIVAADVV